MALHLISKRTFRKVALRACALAMLVPGMGLFIRVPGSPDDSARRNGQLRGGQAGLNRVPAYHSCRKITAALIPEELLSISVHMVGAETRVVEGGAC
jgi:hypothetical protein